MQRAAALDGLRAAEPRLASAQCDHQLLRLSAWASGSEPSTARMSSVAK